MRVTGNQYAKALYELTTGKSQEEISGVVSRFIKTLAKNGQMKMKNEILRKFEAVSNQKNGIIVAEVKSREKMNNELSEKLVSYIKEKYAAKEAVVKNIVDEKIQGGVIVKVGDEIFDASVRGQLKKIKAILGK